jgi:hypothetical protein
MRYEESLGMAGTGIRLFLGNPIGGKTGNFATNARAFTREHRDSVLLDLLLRPALARGANTLHALNVQREVGRISHGTLPFAESLRKDTFKMGVAALH